MSFAINWQFLDVSLVTLIKFVIVTMFSFDLFVTKLVVKAYWILTECHWNYSASRTDVTELVSKTN